MGVIKLVLGIAAIVFAVLALAGAAVFGLAAIDEAAIAAGLAAGAALL